MRVSRKWSSEDVESDESFSRFPFNVPAVRSLETLDFETPVTFFVGENGSGKSTLLEALAIAAELHAYGSDPTLHDRSLAPQRHLAERLRLAWGRRTRRGFFLRAEDFFGYLKRQARDDARLARERAEALGLSPTPEPLDQNEHHDEWGSARYVERHDNKSHGESFIELFATRITGGGIYLLDEPEAPLSPTRQVALLAHMMKATAAGAQLVIATHSPIILGFPGARIYSFDETPIQDVRYETLEHVAVTRRFLNDRSSLLKAIAEDDG